MRRWIIRCAATVVDGGKVTVEPGTAIGFRQDSVDDGVILVGMDLWDGSTLTSHGTPDRPIIFTEVRLAQEQPIGLQPSKCTLFRTGRPLEFQSAEIPGQAPPVMDCRFCNFYISPGSGSRLCGHSVAGQPSPLWDLRRRPGPHASGLQPVQRLDLYRRGHAPTEPSRQCAFSWVNNLFDRMLIFVGPDDRPSRPNRGLVFRGPEQPLSRRSLGPVSDPGNRGQLVLWDNLFDKAYFWQDTEHATGL